MHPATMEYLIWSVPITVVLGSIILGVLSPTSAGLLGTGITIAIALSFAPTQLTPLEVLHVTCEGGWIAALAGIVIFAGLFFREAIGSDSSARSEVMHSPGSQRARCFDACFLIGPFMEAITGFGLGQVAAIAALSRAGLAPLHTAVLALLSGIMVPWGAMANGTMVGAALAHLSPSELGLRSAILTIPLLFGWLALFWREAGAAGVSANGAERTEEVCWIAGTAALLVCCNYLLGPEIAGITSLGSLIALRYYCRERLSAARFRIAVLTGWPYLALISGLVAARLVSSIMPSLASALSFQPFGNAPPFQLLTHPAAWLIIAGLLTALFSAPVKLADAISPACRKGFRPVLTILVFLVMAKLTTACGVADALAGGIRNAMGTKATLAVPLLAGLFGFITGSGNASNGLLMHAQLSFTRDMHLDPLWIAAIQNTAAAALTMLSPSRVAMGCAIAGVPHLERAVYFRAWPLGAVALAILVGISAFLS
jgi:lactate permease